MSRYRKIEVRTWSDERFCALSPMQPSGQALWFFLLTGPHTGPIPGLFRAGRAALAEELHWSAEALAEAFREVFAEGMAKANFEAKLVWLPNALKHNRPESPNVVRSWRAELEGLPECELRDEALAAIRETLANVGPAYSQAFDEINTVKPSRKASRKAFGKPFDKAMANQEQEQEQEQQQEQDLDQKQKQPPAAQAALRAQAKMPDLPDWIDAEAWGGFVAMRQRERHPLTARAAKLVIAELAKLRAAGADPTAVLDQSTRNGWRDVYPIKTNGSGPPRAQSAQPSVAADFRQTRYEGTPDEKLPASLRI